LLLNPLTEAISNRLFEKINVDLKKDLKKQFPQPDENKTVQWDFPAGFNMVQMSKIKRKKEGSLSFNVLRNFSVNYPIARSCIDYIKTKAIKLKWEVIPEDEEQKVNPDDKRVKQVSEFFKRPLGARSTYMQFIEVILEDYLVIGSIALERVRTKGGKFLDELKAVDSSTIRIFIDEEGRIPEPPEPAFAQVVGGRVVARLTLDELIFQNRQNRTSNIYGLSPIESILIQADSAIRGAKNSQAFFSEGTMPEGFMDTPEGWTVDQTKSFERYFNALVAGNPMYQRKIKFIPHGSKWMPLKEPDKINFERFELWLMKQTCSVFGVPPADVGFTDDVNRATSETQRELGQERAMRPIVRLLEDMFTAIIQNDFGFVDLRFTYVDVDPVDKKLEAEVDNIRIKGGVVGVDEIRGREGLKPLGLGPYVAQGKGIVLVEELIANGTAGNQEKESENEDEPEEPEEGSSHNSDHNSEHNSSHDDDKEALMRQDFILWRKVSNRALKRKETFKKFKSAVLDDWMIDEIYYQLQLCETKIAVDEVFKPYINSSMLKLNQLKKIADELKTIAAPNKEATD